MTAANPIVLEPAAQQVADAFSKPPFLYEMAPADARKVLEDAQSAPVNKLPVDEEWITVRLPSCAPGSETAEAPHLLVVQSAHGQVDGCSRHPARLVGSHEDRHV